MKVPSSILKTMLVTTGGLAISAGAVGIAKGVTTPEPDTSNPEYTATPKTKATPAAEPTATPVPRQPFRVPCPACGMG